MRGLNLTIALLAMLSAVAAADGSEKILGGADEKPSLLRKFHVHYKMPQTFVDVPQDSAGAGLSSYGGVARTVLMVCLLMFSISHFLPHFQSVGGDQLGASEEEESDEVGFLDDYDDVDNFADHENQWDVEPVEVEGCLVAEEHSTVPAVTMEAAAAEVEAAAPALDQKSCLLLAQNDMFADAEVAARLAEQCWRAEKRARIQHRAAELLKVRRSKDYNGIHSTLETDTFEVLAGTANVGPQFVTGTLLNTPETSPGSSLASSPIKGKLSATAQPFHMNAENIPPPPLTWSLLDASGAPTQEFLRQQSRTGAHSFDKKGAHGSCFLGAAAPLALVALAVVPSMNSSARRKLAGGSHNGAGHLTAFPTNQHKKPRRADKADSLPWQGAYPGVRRYDVIRSS